jgi:hypothetical protein
MITVISFGEMVIGKVSRTTRRHYIATKFFHICYVPLIPVESFIFTGAYVISIGMDGLSVLTGYLRTGLAAATTLAVFGGLVQLGTSNPLRPELTRAGHEWLITGCVLATCFAATYYVRAITTASPAREAWINGRLAKTRALVGERPIFVPPGMDGAASTGSDSTPNVDGPPGAAQAVEADEVRRSSTFDVPIVDDATPWNRRMR